ncbi:hypothetical protein DD595_26535, partial [Enterobacter cloacae complex sp. 4DZ3-17B2]|uniref:reverse transcriptase domain-containing protein n=1 Tax=Enterobacter cloacae complex sp. 4DZ3-17B2 TaxID=2511990 RepID=UPI001025CA24
VHKKGDRFTVSNYRPISILSTFSKLFDKTIAKYISNLIYPRLIQEQHGFTRGRSTVSNLFLFTELVSSALEHHSQVDTIYIDLSKASIT